MKTSNRELFIAKRDFLLMKQGLFWTEENARELTEIENELDSYPNYEVWVSHSSRDPGAGSLQGE